MGLNPKGDTDALNMIYRLKECFGPPDQYLGAIVDKVQLEDGQVVCYTNCVDYLKSVINNVDNSLLVDKMALNNDGYEHRTYSSSFRSGSYVTKKLGE